MQKLIIAGVVGRDATLRRLQSGEAVLNFSLAVDNGKDKDGRKRDPTWFDCSLWGRRAEALETHIVKGLRLTLDGRPTSREHNGKAYLGITINDLTFQGGGDGRCQSADRDSGQSGHDHTRSHQRPIEGQRDDRSFARDLDDEIPF